MELIATETLVIELLLIVSVVAVVVRRLRIPYTVALVVVGLVLTFEESLKVALTPDLILALFVPPLVFEAAFHIEFDRLRDDLVPILALAIPGVLLTMAIVGLIVSAGIDVPLTMGLVFGALIAATDPVAVVALFRALGAPKRLALLVEGESLFNDGTAIVLFGLVLTAAGIPTAHAAEGATTFAEFNLISSIIDFFVVSLGGLATGGVLGWVVSRFISRLDDYLIEITLTTVLVFGAYLVAEALHVSGVLAVVAAGMVNGNIGHRGMSPTTRIVLFNFWEYVAFVANSLVFLLIGLEVKIPELTENIPAIGVAIIAVVISRALSVYVLGALVSLRGRKTPTVYRHVQFWGGLRGAISLALVLSLPLEFEGRSLLLSMTFGVVLFTLLVQGTSMQFLMSRLGLVRRDEDALEYERRHARLVAARAASDHLDEMRRGGLVSTATWERLKPALDKRIETCLEAQNALLRDKPELQREEIDDARREGLRAERAALSEMLHDGLISEPVFEELVVEIDAALERPLHLEQPETDSDAAPQSAP